MTDQGIYDFIDRLQGTYPLQYKGFSTTEMDQIRAAAKRNYQAFTDDEVYDALTAYINGPESRMPPSPGQLKALMVKEENKAEIDFDTTRLCYDDEGRLWYNQAYEKAPSDTHPGKKVLKPIGGSRPFDGKKDYCPARVPHSNEELVAICKKRGWSYRVTQRINGLQDYDWDPRLHDYLNVERAGFEGNIEDITNRVLKRA